MYSYALKTTCGGGDLSIGVDPLPFMSSYTRVSRNAHARTKQALCFTNLAFPLHLDCSRVFGQHASQLEWSAVHGAVSKLFCAHVLVPLPCHGHRGIPCFFHIHCQNFWSCQGRLNWQALFHFWPHPFFSPYLDANKIDRLSRKLLPLSHIFCYIKYITFH